MLELFAPSCSVSANLARELFPQSRQSPCRVGIRVPIVGIHRWWRRRVLLLIYPSGASFIVIRFFVGGTIGRPEFPRKLVEELHVYVLWEIWKRNCVIAKALQHRC